MQAGIMCITAAVSPCTRLPRTLNHFPPPKRRGARCRQRRQPSLSCTLALHTPALPSPSPCPCISAGVVERVAGSGGGRPRLVVMPLQDLPAHLLDLARRWKLQAEEAWRLPSHRGWHVLTEPVVSTEDHKGGRQRGQGGNKALCHRPGACPHTGAGMCCRSLR